MVFREMIIGTLLMAVFLLSFGICESEATTSYSPCGMGDCEYAVVADTNITYTCGPYIHTEMELPQSDPKFNYPYGLLAFVISNNELMCPASVASSSTQITAQELYSATITFAFRKSSDHTTPIDLTGFVYRKYGPTPDNPSPHWYDFMYDGTTGAEINGNEVTLHFVDGLRGDEDITVNDIIVDQGGPGQQVSNVPTMTEWGMILFIILAGLGAVYCLSRHRIT